MASDGYEWDFFLSYSRRSTAGKWVKNHFYEILCESLADELPEKPRIFVDYKQQGGVSWPDGLAYALKRSRYLLAIWSPQYFQSDWCMAEWQSMRERENLLGLSSAEQPEGLVLPIKYSDGDHYHEDAKNTQFCCDMSPYRVPEPVFRESKDWVPFRQEVNRLAEMIAPRLAQAPAWKPDWPFVQPPPMRPQSSGVPRH